MILLALVALVASPPNVTKLVLAPAQVGDGYVVIPRADGVGVKNTVTLNLCGNGGYPSEQLRKTRLQVDYARQNSQIGLSNEVVTYTKGGASQAMREALHRALTCPRKAIKADPSLPPLRFDFVRLKAAKLIKGYIALRVHVTGMIKGKKVDDTSYAVYQRLGDVLSGTYSFGPDTKEQLRFVLHAAQQSAINLRRGKALSGPTA
jgi:hypothetical protein